MGKMVIGLCIVASVLFADVAVGQYVPPKATVEPLSPKGIRISIPHEKGMTLVAFHAKINDDFDTLEAGSISVDVIKPRNGRWTYKDQKTELSIGDVVYYWVHVDYQGGGYNLLDQHHRVTEFFDINGNRVDSGSESNTPAPRTEPGACEGTDSKIYDVQTGRAKGVCAGQLLLEDQFNILNETLWRKIEKIAGVPDYPFVVYRNDRRNVRTENGNLQLTPTLVETEFGRDFIRRGNLTLERCTESYGSADCQRTAVGRYIIPPVLSGSLDTKNSFAFLYGKVEIRAKLPRGDWIVPMLTLEPLEGSYNSGSGPSYPSMRVASSSGNAVLRSSDNNDISGRVLCSGPVEAQIGVLRTTSIPKKFTNNLWSDDYHIYELEWRRDRIVSRVDGIEYGSTVTRPPFDKPFYLNLGVAVGGHNEFPDDAMSGGYRKPWRNVDPRGLLDFFNSMNLWSGTWNTAASRLNIDYIKVWAL